MFPPANGIASNHVPMGHPDSLNPVPCVKSVKLHGNEVSSWPHNPDVLYATKQPRLAGCRLIQAASKAPLMLVYAMCKAWMLLGSWMSCTLPLMPVLLLRINTRKADCSPVVTACAQAHGM
jgi:hypothetical protein